MKKIRKYIGDKEFYSQVFTLIIPIMIQQLFISVGGYIDGVMINSYGEGALAYNGVNAANRLMFVCNFVFMGVAAVSSIYIAQYFGANNKEKVKESFRLGTYSSILFGILSIIIINVFGKSVINSYIQNDVSRQYGYDYLRYMSYGMIVISLNAMIANSLRSIKKPRIAMISSVIGIIVNVTLNYLLIFGHFGLPEMGAAGAALATVISRFVELIINYLVIKFSKDSYFKGSYKTLKVSKELILSSIKKGTPLILNEFMWSMGMILLAKYYTYNNDEWYSSYGYAQNISDLFFICFAALGTSTAVVIGNCLGRSEFKEAEENLYRFRGLAIFMGVTLGILMIFLSPIIIRMFDPIESVRILSVNVLRVTGIFTAIYCYTSVNFFTLRAGGDSLRAFILDQTPTYFVCLPIAIILGVNAEKLGLTVVEIYLFTHIGDVFKIIVSNIFINKKKWLKNLTINEEMENIEYDVVEGRTV